jgi:hydroxypyruvate reductase
MSEAGHPMPDQFSVAAAAQALSFATSATAEDIVLVLISGGASANWVAPSEGLTLADKQAVTYALLRSGANIEEINIVRKHLSRIKGGRLAEAAYPANLVTLAISDVPGDDPSSIGSGPTIADHSTLSDMRAVIHRFKLDLPPAVSRAIEDPRNESPKPGHFVFERARFQLVARPMNSFSTVQAEIRAAGYECIFLGEHIEGEARAVAAEQAALAKKLKNEGRRAVILSGGELTVTVKGQGRGGPNQEYALALALALDGAPGIAAIAADTDGTDGGVGSASDPAGARVDGSSASRARELGLDPVQFLADNNSTAFFSSIGDLVMPGPTFTNVNDFRAILVDSQ